MTIIDLMWLVKGIAGVVALIYIAGWQEPGPRWHWLAPG